MADSKPKPRKSRGVVALARLIVGEMFADFYDRAEFDWWWDNIEPSIKREIRKVQQSKVEAILRKAKGEKK